MSRNIRLTNQSTDHQAICIKRFQKIVYETDTIRFNRRNDNPFQATELETQHSTLNGLRFSEAS